MDRFEMELTFDELKLLRKLVTDDLLEKQAQEVCFSLLFKSYLNIFTLFGLSLLYSVFLHALMSYPHCTGAKLLYSRICGAYLMASSLQSSLIPSMSFTLSFCPSFLDALASKSVPTPSLKKDIYNFIYSVLFRSLLPSTASS